MVPKGKNPFGEDGAPQTRSLAWLAEGAANSQSQSTLATMTDVTSNHANVHSHAYEHEHEPKLRMGNGTNGGVDRDRRRTMTLSMGEMGATGDVLHGETRTESHLKLNLDTSTYSDADLPPIARSMRSALADGGARRGNGGWTSGTGGPEMVFGFVPKGAQHDAAPEGEGEPAVYSFGAKPRVVVPPAPPGRPLNPDEEFDQLMSAIYKASTTRKASMV